MKYIFEHIILYTRNFHRCRKEEIRDRDGIRCAKSASIFVIGHVEWCDIEGPVILFEGIEKLENFVRYNQYS